MDTKYIIGIIIAIIVIVGAYLVLAGGGQTTINIAGSTSVQPVAQKLADAYMQQHPNVKITVQGGGSAVGLSSVNQGTAQIGTYSSKLAANDSAGINQYQIANDGLAIIVNKANTGITDISVDKIKAIFTGNDTNWSQVGSGSGNITVVTRESGSGTRDAITKLALNNSNITSTAIVQTSTGAVIQAVQGDPNAIGYASLADLNGNVTALTLNGVQATADNVANGKYTLQRPFLFLTKGPATGATLDFINWVLSPAGQAIVKQAGAVPIGPTS